MKLISSLRRDKIIIVVSHKELTSIDFNKHLGSNHKLINLVIKEYKKHY